MLAAFLCDVTLLRESKGRRSISEVFREIYRQHRAPNERQEGNAAILKILKNYPELAPIVEKYIVGAEKIDWKTNLESVGIEAKEESFITKLDVKAKLSGKQKDLLDKLGYNNWRKTSDKKK
jgi:predicted metalloprotease with PDZ domain